MKTYTYQNGMTENIVKNLVNGQMTNAQDYIKTIEGEYFTAKARNTVADYPTADQPHLKVVTVQFANGRKAHYSANMNNGIATFIKFLD